MSVRPAKTQISLGICPVWSESSLCAQWVAKDPRFLHANSEDWSNWANAQADLSLHWAHSHFVGFCHVAAQILYSVLKTQSFGTDEHEQTVQIQTRLIRVYTVCHSFKILWTQCCMLKQHYSHFRIITVIISGVLTFIIFTVNTLSKLKLPSAGIRIWHYLLVLRIIRNSLSLFCIMKMWALQSTHFNT